MCPFIGFISVPISILLSASILLSDVDLCDVSFVDESGQVYFGKPVDYGTRFLETDYPEDPEDNSQKIFVGWIVNGSTPDF